MEFKKGLACCPKSSSCSQPRSVLELVLPAPVRGVTREARSGSLHSQSRQDASRAVCRPSPRWVLHSCCNPSCESPSRLRTALSARCRVKGLLIVANLMHRVGFPFKPCGSHRRLLGRLAAHRLRPSRPRTNPGSQVQQEASPVRRSCSHGAEELIQTRRECLSLLGFMSLRPKTQISTKAVF